MQKEKQKLKFSKKFQEIEKHLKYNVMMNQAQGDMNKMTQALKLAGVP